MIEEDVGMRISSVVVMGIGEPFDNYDNIMDFIRIINSPFGIAIEQDILQFQQVDLYQ